MYKWSGADNYPAYFLKHPMLLAKPLTYPEAGKSPADPSNKFSSYDSPTLFDRNLKKQPTDWRYHSKEITYECNSNGYRAREWDTINWSTAVVLFGCSCVFGVGVAEDETISYYLEQLLGRPVVNMGVSASSMQFAFINSTLLTKHFPAPHAVVQLWSSLDRQTIFTEQTIDHIGPWSNNASFNDTVTNPYHAMLNASYLSIASRELWKGRCNYYSASFFEPTAHYTESDLLVSDKQARDLLHPGPNATRRAAELIASKIN